MDILIVCSKCDAVGSFPACVYPFLLKTANFLISRAARKITATWIVICRADLAGRACIACSHVHGQLCVANKTLLIRFVSVSGGE